MAEVREWRDSGPTAIELSLTFALAGSVLLLILLLILLLPGPVLSLLHAKEEHEARGGKLRGSKSKSKIKKWGPILNSMAVGPG
jgi:hypothetical protein